MQGKYICDQEVKNRIDNKVQATEIVIYASTYLYTYRIKEIYSPNLIRIASFFINRKSLPLQNVIVHAMKAGKIDNQRLNKSTKKKKIVAKALKQTAQSHF